MAFTYSVGDVLLIGTWFTRGQSNAAMFWPFRPSLVVGSPPSNLLALSYAARAISLFGGTVADTTIYAGTTIQRIWPTMTAREWYADGAALAGAGSSDMAPRQLSILARLYGDRSRGIRTCLKYIPFPTAFAMDPGGVINTIRRNNARNRVGDMVAQRVLSGVGGIVRIECVNFRRSTGEWEKIVNVKVPAEWATQRRRGDYGTPTPLPT